MGCICTALILAEDEALEKEAKAFSANIRAARENQFQSDEWEDKKKNVGAYCPSLCVSSTIPHTSLANFPCLTAADSQKFKILPCICMKHG